MKQVTPTSEAAQRIATVMHRRLSTPWSEREIKQFRKLVKIGCFATLDDLALVERYYKKHWPPRNDKNILRHDLYTLIYNWQGEVDRATAWNEAHPLKPIPRKIIPLHLPGPSDSYVAPSDPESLARFQAERLERKNRKEAS